MMMSDDIFLFDESGTILERVKDKSIKSVTIPNCVKSIGVGAFFGHSSLTSIDIPNSVTSIGDFAFYGCSNLTSIDIPNSVTSIGNGAFYGCSNLTSIDIPNSVTSIGDGAFYDCSNLTSIKVDTANPKYDSRNDCNAIIETPSNTLIIGCKNTVIPNSVTSIGNGAFYDCSNLTSINIPNSVTSIGEKIFEKCESLRTIHSTAMIIDSINIADNAFDGFIIDNCTLYIPSGTRWAYRHHPIFSKFKNIEIEAKKKE